MDYDTERAIKVPFMKGIAIPVLNNIVTKKCTYFFSNLINTMFLDLETQKLENLKFA